MRNPCYSPNTIATILTIVAVIFLFYKKFVNQKISDTNKTNIGFFCGAAGTSLTVKQYSHLDMLMQKLNKYTFSPKVYDIIFIFNEFAMQLYSLIVMEHIQGITLQKYKSVF